MPKANADPPPRPAARDRALLPVREFHDRGALWLFEDPRQLRELLQILEPALADMLDFARARRENRSFIPADLQKQESDLILDFGFWILDFGLPTTSKARTGGRP